MFLLLHVRAINYKRLVHESQLVSDPPETGRERGVSFARLSKALFNSAIVDSVGDSGKVGRGIEETDENL